MDGGRSCASGVKFFSCRAALSLKQSPDYWKRSSQPVTEKEKTAMSKPDHFYLRNGLTAEHSGCRWFLPIFVAIACTNLVSLPPVLAANGAKSEVKPKLIVVSQTPAPSAEGVLTPIADINKSLTNHEVTVQAAVSNIREPRSERAPYSVTLTEAGASIPLVYWSDMQAQLGSKVKTGNVVRAKVTVSVYRDNLQLRIYDANALEVVGVAGPPPTATVIGKIKADWVDRAVIISGTISGSETTDKGRQLKVQDATGEIPVVLDEKVLSGLAAAELLPGRALTVTGPVKLYDGKPAVVPEAASAVKLKRE
jgi:hypothetical protein